MLRHALRMRPSRVLLSCRRRQASAAGPTAAECGPEKRGWAMVLGTGNLLKPKKLAVVCLAALASYLYVVFPWYPLWKISTTVSRAPEVWIDRKGCLFSSEKAIKSLIDYWMVTGDEISQGKKRSFMLFLGPNGVGKSTTIERAIAGRRGVVKVVVNVEPGKKVVVEKEVARSLGLDPQTADLQGFLMNLNSWLRWLPFFGCPLLLYVDVQVGNKNEQLSYSNCARIANSVRAFGRKYSYDQPTCPVVVEVSVLQIGDVLSQRVGSICEKLQIFPMSRAELFELFEKKHGHNRGWKQILGGAGYRDGLDLFYIKIGGNMRELEAIMNQSSVPDDFLHNLNEKYTDLTHKLEFLTDKELAFCKKVASAGITGLASSTSEDLKMEASLLQRDPFKTVLRKVNSNVMLHSMAHVHYLLNGDKEKMHELGYITHEKAGSS